MPDPVSPPHPPPGGGASPAAESFAQKLPYVRVAVSWQADTNAPRDPAEPRDVFANGLLRRGHKSDRTREVETRLGVQDVLYFHAGRTHPTYGEAVFVLHDLDVDLTATPFGIGGLCCRPADGFSNLDEDDVCAGGGCMCPLACRSDRAQAEFVGRSRWDKGSWRARAAEVIDQYFGPDLARYFAEGDAGRPKQLSPEGRFDPARANGEPHDWRGSTIEIQALQDVDLRTLLQDGKVFLWGYSPTMAGYLWADTVATPFTDDPLETYPFLAELDSLKPVVAGGEEQGTWLDLVDETIQGYVLGSDDMR